MATTTLGKVIITPKGDYDSSTTYNPLDIVTSGGGSYICLESCTGITPGTDATKWMIISRSETYTLSLNGNVLTLTGSAGSSSSVTFTTADSRLW